MTDADPVAVMQGPDDTDAWDEPPLTLPAATGIHAIDDEMKRVRPIPVRPPGGATAGRQAAGSGNASWVGSGVHANRSTGCRPRVAASTNTRSTVGL